MSVRLITGECVQIMREMEPSFVDAICTDPPYGLEFMGKDWDAPWKAGIGLGGMSESGFKSVNLSDGAKRLPRPSFVGGTNPTCKNCRGLKRGRPGKQGQQPCRCDAPQFDNVALPRMRAFQAWSETWLVEALRVLKPGGYLLSFGGTRTYHRLTCAIEDAGFEIRDCLMWMYGSGFPKGKGCLKPGWEPIILARKPGPSPWLNVDGCRIDYETGGNLASNPSLRSSIAGGNGGHIFSQEDDRRFSEPHAAGRWPANICLDEAAAALLDEQSGVTTSNGGANAGTLGKRIYGSYSGGTVGETAGGFGDTGGASRFYYVAKASTAERGQGNDHPTVKPLALMSWLVKLVTPPGGTVLDPFCGSGSTLIAADRLGFGCIGIDKDPHNVEIARRRLTDDAGMFSEVTA